MVEKRENRQKRIKEEMEFMQEMEYMRVQAKVHFPSDFDSMKIWEKALDEKYDYECSIAFMKRDNFDYTVWQREYFDKMESGEFVANAFEYAKSHPYMGKGEIL